MQKYEGYYITPCGRVWSYKRNRFISQHSDKDGYLVCKINRQEKKVHRLVAECWLDNPNNLSQINHKDENKKNNNISNLEWCDARYNSTYSMGKKVINTVDNQVFDSISAAAEAYGINSRCLAWSLQYNCNGKYRMFKYIN